VGVRSSRSARSGSRRGLASPFRARRASTRPDELERRLRERLDALGPAPRAELLHVLMLPDFERADRTLRAVLVGILREAER
jgi:hypothetical protein